MLQITKQNLGGDFMCLIAFAYKTHPDFPIIIIANRDEFYERPTEAVHFWQDSPHILAGRDLRMNGSWLGVSKSGRFAAITNYRDPNRPETGQLSRGTILQSFLNTEQTSADFVEELRGNKDLYGGFNVLLYDGKQMQHYNNVFDEHTVVPPGVHSISNATLNTPWPKVTFAAKVLQQAVDDETIETNQLISLLANHETAPDDSLPDTGVGIYLERALSASFVQLANYGTRCSTALTISKNGYIHLQERTYEQGQFAFDKLFTINKEAY